MIDEQRQYYESLKARFENNNICAVARPLGAFGSSKGEPDLETSNPTTFPLLSFAGTVDRGDRGNYI